MFLATYVPVNKKTTMKTKEEKLMAEMFEAITGALGTFVAIERGVLQMDSNPITGEGLVEISKGQKEILRKVFDKYRNLSK